MNGISFSENLSLFCVVGANGTILTSPDGITWTSQTSGVTTDLYNATYSESLDKYVMVGALGVILTSPNGISWTKENINTTTNLWSVTYSSALQLFIIVGYSGIILIDSDGKDWEVQPSGVTVNFYSVIENNDKFHIVGNNGEILTLSVPAFTLYLDDEGTGSKSYLLYLKNVTYGLKLTTSHDLSKSIMLKAGTNIFTSWIAPDGDILLK